MMTRRMMIESIRSDPEWNSGNYTKQPRSSCQTIFSITTSGGTISSVLQKAAPTREKADQLVNQRLAQPARADANDLIYQYESARDYNPTPKLESIKARVLAINAEDDERNPIELGIMEREIKRVAQGRYVLITAVIKPPATAPPAERSGGSSIWRSFYDRRHTRPSRMPRERSHKDRGATP